MLALIHAARKLKLYFLTHHICLRTDQLFRQILLRHEASGRFTKWAIELGEYDLSYESRTAIKAQVLADFLADLIFSASQDSTSDSFELLRWSLIWTGLPTVMVVGQGCSLKISTEKFVRTPPDLPFLHLLMKSSRNPDRKSVG